MIDARNFFSGEQKQRIEAAIAQTESETGIEIICAVSSESGRYDRAESLVGLCGALAGLGVIHILIGLDAGEGSFANEHASLLWQSIAVVAGFVFGNFFASYVHTIRKIFTTRKEMEAETNAAAARVFMERCKTPRRPNGALLLYVSLYERRLVVLADGAASSAGGDAIASALRDIVERELRANQRDAAFLKALELLRERLAGLITPKANVLPNTLAIFHPRP